ncbi:unnamed protein product, partial [marine sediment metagenome]
MPEQTAEATLKAALRESQIRNTKMRTIEARLEGEIDDMKSSKLTPKAGQKASMLETAKALITKVMNDGREE